MALAINPTHGPVVSTYRLTARETGGDFVARKDDMGLNVALRTMLLTREPAAAVGATQVLGAVHLLVHHAQGLVIRAY